MRAFPVMILCSFLLAGSTFAMASPKATGADLTQLRQRATALLAGEIGDAGGPRRSKAIAALDRRIAGAMSDDGDALDFAGPEDDSKSNRLSRHFRRIAQLAQGWAADGGRYCRDASVLERIETDLRRGLPFLAPGEPQPGNWHGYLITTPRAMTTILLLVGDHLDASVRRDLEVAVETLMGTMRLSGANAASEAYNNILFGAYKGDGDRVARSVAHMMTAVTCGNTEGILEDYAYQFHGRIPYAAGYGSVLLAAVSRSVFLVSGTPWAVDLDRNRLLNRLALEHMQWMVSGRSWDISVRGRSFLSLGDAWGLMASLLLLGAGESPERPALQAAAARMATRYDSLPLDVAGLADRAAASPAPPLKGWRYFHTSDLAASHGDGFYVGLRMYSRRMQDYEVLTLKGMNGWNLPNGLTHISRGSNEWWSGSGKRPIDMLDMDHLPGTTARVGANPPDQPKSIHESVESLNFGRSEFSGGAGDDIGGIAGFILIPTRGDFVARKGYFFFDEGLVAVGSGITSTGDSAKPIHTTVAQWAAPIVDSPLHLSGDREEGGWEGVKSFPDVRWAWLDGVGYVFGEPVTLYAVRNERLTTLWLDHGASPRDADYAYLVLPTASLERTRSEAAAPRIRILSNTPQLQVVADSAAPEPTKGLIFYAPGKHESIAVDKPAIVYGRVADAAAVLAFQNPLHTTDDLTVTVGGALGRLPVETAPQEAAVQQADGAWEITCATALGRPYRVGFGAGADVRQPLRENMLAYYEILQDATSDATSTWLTIRLPAEARGKNPRVVVRGFKSHNLVTLTDANVVDRPTPGVAVYRWDRVIDPNHKAASLFNQRVGSFRLALIHDRNVGVDYFTVPPELSSVQPVPESWLDEDKTRPPGIEH